MSHVEYTCYERSVGDEVCCVLYKCSQCIVLVMESGWYSLKELQHFTDLFVLNKCEEFRLLDLSWLLVVETTTINTKRKLVSPMPENGKLFCT